MNSELDNLTKIVKLLDEGAVVLCPTDTIWGLSCDAMNLSSVRRIFDIKSRDLDKPLILLFSQVSEIKKYVKDLHPRVEDLLIYYQKPVTFIHRAGPKLPRHLVNKDGTVAIRLTQDDTLRELIDDLGRPIVSTSANIQGEPSPTGYPEITEKVKSQVDYIFKARRVNGTNASASQIIKYDKDGQLIFIRE